MLLDDSYHREMVERERARHDGFLVRTGQVWVKLNRGNGLVQLNTDDSVREMVEGNWHLPASVGGTSELLINQGAPIPSPVVGWGGREERQSEAPDWTSQVGFQGAPFLLIVLIFPKSFYTTP